VDGWWLVHCSSEILVFCLAKWKNFQQSHTKSQILLSVETHLSKSTVWRWCIQLHYQWFLTHFPNCHDLDIHCSHGKNTLRIANATKETMLVDKGDANCFGKFGYFAGFNMMNFIYTLTLRSISTCHRTVSGMQGCRHKKVYFNSRIWILNTRI
jgi:hypothetical protein